MRFEIELYSMPKLLFHFKHIYLQLTQIVVLLTLLFTTNLAFASFHKNMWPQWGVHNPLSQASISHDEWQEFLTRHVITNQEGINLIDYPHLTEADLEALNLYITHMSQIHLENYNRNEQLAFWINLYNALTVQILADYYPVDSIQEISISPGLFNTGPWGAKLITMGSTQFSLDDIQNHIIRPIWNDPRTHYALNNATIGAANLNKQAFQGIIINDQLNQAAQEYINSLRGLQIIDGKLILSKIYNWYSDDFGGKDSLLIQHLYVYANKPLRNQLQNIQSVNSYIYNWHLNSTIDDAS